MARPGLGTRCVQAGYSPKNGEPRQIPIIQSTTFKYESSAEMGKLFDLEASGYFYSRLQNPTNDAVAARIAALEGGTAAMLTGSGMSAIFFSVFNIVGAGDHLVSSSSIYGGSFNLFSVTMKRMGVEVTFVDPDCSPEELDAAFRPNTKAMYGEAIADLIEDGHEVVIAHGNGPQVGMIQNAFAAYHKQQAKSDIMPLSMCVAMSQGYIGYDLQNMIGEELDRRGLGIHCATVLTQVAVDPADPAFQHPTKPIGAFMTEEEAKKLAAEKGIDVAEDAGRGWRQVVASPRPKEIVEIATVKALMNAKHAVIAAGGGGIPVVLEDKYHLKGVPAVIDKDFASECMAEQLDADMLIILTAVEKVAINFGKPDQKNLDELTPDEARRYMAEGQFAPGSMLPKVEAAVKFAESKPGRTSLITLLEKAKDGIEGKTGTAIHL